MNRIKGILMPICWFFGGLFGNVKQFLLEFLGNFKIFPWPLWIVYAPHRYRVTGSQLRKALKLIRPGDVVVRGFDNYLISSFFIPGRFSHSGVYVGGEDGLVVHALGTGVQKTDVLDFFRCDKFAILRPKEKVVEGSGTSQVAVAERACGIARNYIGATYDYNFDICEDYKNEGEVQKRTKSVYCHELTRSCYPDLDIPCIKPTLWNGMIRSNKKQFLAQSFFDSPDFEVVFDSFYSEIQ